MINKYLDSDGYIKVWPSKKVDKIEVIKYLSTKFQNDVTYTEQEINAIIDNNHTFNDRLLLRRSLIDYNFLNRTADGSKYWKEVKNEE
jgi:hypothetical protein